MVKEVTTSFHLDGFQIEKPKDLPPAYKEVKLNGTFAYARMESLEKKSHDLKVESHCRKAFVFQIPETVYRPTIGCSSHNKFPLRIHWFWDRSGRDQK